MVSSYGTGTQNSAGILVPGFTVSLQVTGTADICGVQLRKLVNQSVELLSLFLGFDAKSFFWELLLVGIFEESFRRAELIPKFSELSFLVLDNNGSNMIQF